MDIKPLNDTLIIKIINCNCYRFFCASSVSCTFLSSSHEQPTIKHQPSVNLADTAGDGVATSPPGGAVHSTGSKTTLGKSRPDLASVGTTREGTVSIEDGVTSLDEVGVARLAKDIC